MKDAFKLNNIRNLVFISTTKQWYWDTFANRNMLVTVCCLSGNHQCSFIYDLKVLKLKIQQEFAMTALQTNRHVHLTIWYVSGNHQCSSRCISLPAALPAIVRKKWDFKNLIHSENISNQMENADMQSFEMIFWGKNIREKQRKVLKFLLSNLLWLFQNSASNLRKPLGRWSAVRPMINARLAPIYKNASNSICFQELNFFWSLDTFWRRKFEIENWFWGEGSWISGNILDFWGHFWILGKILDFWERSFSRPEGFKAGLKGQTL